MSPCAGARFESNRLNDTPQIKLYPRTSSTLFELRRVAASPRSVSPRPECLSATLSGASPLCPLNLSWRSSGSARAVPAAAATDASPRRDVSRVARAATVNCIDCFLIDGRTDDGGGQSLDKPKRIKPEERSCAAVMRSRRRFTVLRGRNKREPFYSRVFLTGGSPGTIASRESLNGK